MSTFSPPLGLTVAIEGPCHWPVSVQKPSAHPWKVVASDRTHGLWQARFSPNGRWLTFVFIDPDHPDDAHIGILPATGGIPEMRRSIPTPTRWAANRRGHQMGKHCFSCRNKAATITSGGFAWTPPLQGRSGNRSKITRFDRPNVSITADLDSGGELGIAERRLVVAVRTERGNIWMLDNVDK
jgi:hypothetical protein